MDAFRKTVDLINKGFLYISVVMLAIVIIATSIQVFTRYIMNASLSGTDEIARFVFVWMSMLGASLCVSTNGHAVVSIVGDTLKKKESRFYGYHNILIQALIIAGSLVILIYGIKLCAYTGAQRSAGLGIPISFTYACMPVGAAGMILNAAKNIMDDLKGMKGGEAK